MGSPIRDPRAVVIAAEESTAELLVEEPAVALPGAEPVLVPASTSQDEAVTSRQNGS
ncbi:hypothetical protein [Paeniglutamicibacter cryotolerans]|uniref:Uncharacterized protein n=1 Tax=Paeniglutamicibacter cryotolerans TaxID=670079 RepID=A0A839QK91_9MICC|nr:hypothetical protein [Paeniglutamicibacter cryotolerans]